MYSQERLRAAASLHWPNARAMFAGAYTVSLARQVKYSIRTALNAAVLDELLADATQSRCLQALLQCQPRALYPVIQRPARSPLECGQAPAGDAHQLALHGNCAG